MKTSMKMIIVMVLAVIAFTPVFSQTASVTKTKTEKSMNVKKMNTYVIEREIPNVGKSTAEDLQGIAQKSCSVLKELGPDIEWVQSYVTENKIFCIYRAENEAILRTHAMKGGFPINAINLLSTIISPNTATAKLEDIR